MTAVAIGPTRRIAEFVAGATLGAAPPEAIEGAKLSILDTLGCGLAALQQPAAASVLDFSGSMGGNAQATVIGVIREHRRPWPR